MPLTANAVIDYANGFIFAIILIIIFANLVPSLTSAVNDTQTALPDYSGIIGVIIVLAVLGFVLFIVNVFLPKR